jgi:apolipoprotein N-acyltransferase
MVTATTAGTGNWLVSLAEDVIALISTVMAILAPILVALVALFCGLLALWWWGRRQTRLPVARYG